MSGVRTPIYVRLLSEVERQTSEVGLRPSDAFVLRRRQIVLSSAAGKRAPSIANELYCDDDTVLKAIHAFNARGLAALTRQSNRPHKARDVFDNEAVALIGRQGFHLPAADDCHPRKGALSQPRRSSGALRTH